MSTSTMSTMSTSTLGKRKRIKKQSKKMRQCYHHLLGLSEEDQKKSLGGFTVDGIVNWSREALRAEAAALRAEVEALRALRAEACIYPAEAKEGRWLWTNGKVEYYFETKNDLKKHLPWHEMTTHQLVTSAVYLKTPVGKLVLGKETVESM